MLESINEVRKITSSLIRYFDQEGNYAVADLLKNAYPSSQEIAYDGWNGGTYIYAFIYEVEIAVYQKNRSLVSEYENDIKDAAELFLRNPENEQLGAVYIRPMCRQYINWNDLPDGISKELLLQQIETIKALMISVSTGGPRIQEVNDQYKDVYYQINSCLSALGIGNPNTFKDLWEWYGRWSQPDLNTYASRRKFVPQLYQETIDMLEKAEINSYQQEYVPTGWERVDRTVYEMQKRLADAINEEQFQAIGMLGRETLITIAQQVFDKSVHKTEDGIIPSDTDAKRMLDAFLSYSLSGGTNERQRKFAKASVELANQLTHDRMATKKDAEMCLTAVTAVASLIKVISD